MKLAIILRGISYYNSTEKVSNSPIVDYSIHLESMKQNLMNPLSAAFDTIDFFLVTYANDKLHTLMDDFKPLDSIIYSNSDIKKYIPIITTKLLQDSLNLIEPHAMQYDNILITRFDMHYYKTLDMNKVDLNKFNFGWVGEVGQCDDNFLLFQPRHIDKFKQYVSVANSPSCHYINRSFQGECNYISKLDPHNGYHFPNFYIISRYIDDWKSGRLKLY